MAIAFYHPGAGICSAAIALKARVDIAKCVQYNTKLPLELVRDETVFLLGVVVTSREIELLLTRGAEIVYIDHRDNNIEQMKKVSDRITFIIDTNVSMEIQTWKYFFQDQPVPKAVQLRGDYMIWHLNDDVLAFNYGCNVMITSSIDFWLDLIDNKDMVVDKILKRGKIFVHYYNARDRIIAAELVYPTRFQGLPCLAANTRSSSLIFNHAKNENYYFGIQYQWSAWKHEWIVTVSQLPNYNGVSAASLAEAFGGGGSSNIAGFKCGWSELPFNQCGWDEQITEPLAQLEYPECLNEDNIRHDSPLRILIDQEYKNDSRSQCQIKVGDYVAICNNIHHDRWIINSRIAGAADLKVSWCWMAQHIQGSGKYWLRIQSLVPGLDKDIFLSTLDKNNKIDEFIYTNETEVDDCFGVDILTPKLPFDPEA